MTSDEYYAWMLSDDRLFYQVVKNPECPKIRKIHGLKQEQVEAIYKIVRDKYADIVKRVIIFGSAITINCWRGSDLDICIDWVADEEYRKNNGSSMRESELGTEIGYITGFNHDILSYRQFDNSNVYNEIRTKGVVIYMSNLYDRYRVRLRQSKDSLSRATYDDAELDTAAFDAQQAMEFLLKYILDSMNIPYRKTHSIKELLLLLENTEFKFEDSEYAMREADTITSWESESRYGSGVSTVKVLVERAYKIIENIDSAWIEMNKPDNDDNEKKSSVNDLLNKAEGNK